MEILLSLNLKSAFRSKTTSASMTISMNNIEGKKAALASYSIEILKPYIERIGGNNLIEDLVGWDNFCVGFRVCLR